MDSDRNDTRKALEGHEPGQWGLPEGTPLGVDLKPVMLTEAERRVTFRALNVMAWIAEMGADWVVLDDHDAEALRRLARVVLPEGIGIDLEPGE